MVRTSRSGRNALINSRISMYPFRSKRSATALISMLLVGNSGRQDTGIYAKGIFCKPYGSSGFKHTGSQDSIDEIFSRKLSIIILIHFPEEVHHSSLLVVVPPHVASPPVVPAEVLHLFKLLQVLQLVHETTLSLHGQ